MSIFSTLFKRKPKTPADTPLQPLTLEQGIQPVQHIYQQDTLYTLLSLTQADMRYGLSQPYIGALKDGRSVLFLFDRYEDAKAFLANGYEILDGVYPIR